VRTVDVDAAKTQFSRLLDAVAAGEEVVIARAGEPMAKLVPIEAKPPKRRLGRLEGKYTVPEDFDAPLPDDLLDAFEGR
jgi:prevent-host-death family protein